MALPARLPSPAALTINGAGTVVVTASFAATTNYTAASASQTINVSAPVPTYDAVTSVQYASTQLVYPGATNITVCIAPAHKITATGSLQIFDGTKLLATTAVQGGGCAYWYIWPGLIAGTHSISAVYSGYKKNPGGASAPTNILVNPVQVNLGVACWNASFAYGANNQCTVSACSNAGSAQGVITYVVDGGSTPVSVSISNGNAQFIVAQPLPGPHTVNIAYAQQTNYAASAPTQNFTVTPAPVVVAPTPSGY